MLNIIDFIIINKKLKQKDIADKLGVSRAQVSKWKAGEQIPLGREEELLKLAGLFGHDTDWAMFAKSKKNSDNWFKYIQDINQLVDIPSNNIQDSPEIYVPRIILELNKLGAHIPKKAPNIPDYSAEEDEELDDPLREVLIELVQAIGYLEQWSCRYLMPHENHEVYEAGLELESFISSIAYKYVDEQHLARLGVESKELEVFISGTIKEAREYIKRLCRTMRAEKIPFDTDYFDLINKHPYELDDEELISSLFTNSIDDLLPYGERKILETVTFNKKLLEELHLKIDLLLTDRDRKEVEEIITHTPPSGNPCIMKREKK